MLFQVLRARSSLGLASSVNKLTTTTTTTTVSLRRVLTPVATSKTTFSTSRLVANGNSSLDYRENFADRHIGVGPKDEKAMLDLVGLKVTRFCRSSFQDEDHGDPFVRFFSLSASLFLG